MFISPKDIIPITKARAKPTELCEEAEAGKTVSLKKLLTRYGR